MVANPGLPKNMVLPFTLIWTFCFRNSPYFIFFISNPWKSNLIPAQTKSAWLFLDWGALKMKTIERNRGKNLKGSKPCFSHLTPCRKKPYLNEELLFSFGHCMLSQLHFFEICFLQLSTESFPQHPTAGKLTWCCNFLSPVLIRPVTSMTLYCWCKVA